MNTIVYLVIYFVAYSMVTGLWNYILTKITEKKMKDMINNGYSTFNAGIRYGMAINNCWYVKMSGNLLFLPLVNVIVMWLWPLYVPALVITALRCLKYYKPEPGDRLEDDEEAEEIEEDGA